MWVCLHYAGIVNKNFVLFTYKGVKTAAAFSKDDSNKTPLIILYECLIY